MTTMRKDGFSEERTLYKKAREADSTTWKGISIFIVENADDINETMIQRYTKALINPTKATASVAKNIIGGLAKKER
jgi:hypothetical protein